MNAKMLFDKLTTIPKEGTDCRLSTCFQYRNVVFFRHSVEKGGHEGAVVHCWATFWREKLPYVPEAVDKSLFLLSRSEVHVKGVAHAFSRHRDRRDPEILATWSKAYTKGIRRKKKRYNGFYVHTQACRRASCICTSVPYISLTTSPFLTSGHHVFGRAPPLL